MAHKDIKMHKVTPRSYREEMLENERNYPDFHIDDDHLPEVKDWKNGEFYEIKMLVKQVRSSEDHGAGFEIHKIGGKPAGKKNSSKGKSKRFSRANPTDDE